MSSDSRCYGKSPPLESWKSYLLRTFLEKLPLIAKIVGLSIVIFMLAFEIMLGRYGGVFVALLIFVPLLIKTKEAI